VRAGPADQKLFLRRLCLKLQKIFYFRKILLKIAVSSLIMYLLAIYVNLPGFLGVHLFARAFASLHSPFQDIFLT
jgi:hypothetical protein